MARTWTAHKRSFALSLSVLLLTWACGGGSGKGEASEQQEAKLEDADNEAGKELYVANCGSCHQGNGSGVPGMYPPLKGTKTVRGKKQKLIRIVLEGMEGKIEVKGRQYNRKMPAQDHLSDEEVAKVLSYVREKFGDGAGEVTAAEVGELREEGSTQ